MADITMCAAKKCVFENECYRKTAIADPLYQSYSDFSDGKEIEKKEECEYFYKR